MFDVKISDLALEEFDDLPASIQERIHAVVERLKYWPNLTGAKPLVENWRGHFRIRTGDYRIIFRPLGKTIFVERIANRRDIYE